MGNCFRKLVDENNANSYRYSDKNSDKVCKCKAGCRLKYANIDSLERMELNECKVNRMGDVFQNIGNNFELNFKNAYKISNLGRGLSASDTQISRLNNRPYNYENFLFIPQIPIGVEAHKVQPTQNIAILKHNANLQSENTGLRFMDQSSRSHLYPNVGDFKNVNNALLSPHGDNITELSCIQSKEITPNIKSVKANEITENSLHIDTKHTICISVPVCGKSESISRITEATYPKLKQVVEKPPKIPRYPPQVRKRTMHSGIKSSDNMNTFNRKIPRPSSVGIRRSYSRSIEREPNVCIESRPASAFGQYNNSEINQKPARINKNEHRISSSTKGNQPFYTKQASSLHGSQIPSRCSTPRHTKLLKKSTEGRNLTSNKATVLPHARLEYTFFVKDEELACRPLVDKRIDAIAKSHQCAVRWISRETNSPPIYYKGMRVLPVTISAMSMVDLKRCLSRLDMQYPHLNAKAFLPP